MDFFNGFLKHYWYYVVIGVLSLVLAVTTYFCFDLKKDDIQSLTKEDYNVSTIGESDIQKFYVDIKGAVKKPNVYEITSDNIINDVIKLAGGFTKKAYTKNINLSKKVKNEMVIYVYTESEYKKLNEPIIDECICPSYNIEDCLEQGSSIMSTDESESIISDTSTTESTELKDSKISINKASLEELMTLNGIGEAKAKGIIEYRNQNNGFKTVEEIKNVSGIGNAAYEKIKDNIML